MGLLTLVACSEDVYQEADKMSESGGAVENTGPQNSIKTVDPAIGYQSPYDVAYGACCNSVEYIIMNNTTLEFMYWVNVGLAKYDGAEDNNHFGWPLTPASNYPNILAIEANEYLNLLPTKPDIIGAGSTKNSLTGGQLPVGTGASFFTFEPIQGITALETGLLHEYGKVYSYFLEATDPVTNNVVSIVYQLRVPFLPSGITTPNQLSSDWQLLPHSPNLMDKDFWYNIKSREICAGADYPNVDTQVLI